MNETHKGHLEYVNSFMFVFIICNKKSLETYNDKGTLRMTNSPE